jgi:hypothetical protein
MRRPFSDVERIRKEARTTHSTFESRVRRWWTRKYKLPPTSPLFLEQRFANLLQEFFEDLWGEYEVLKEVIDKEGRLEPLDHARLIELENALLDATTELHDPLIEKWERELREGRVPDLDEGLPEPRKKR